MKDFLTDEEMALEEAKSKAPDFISDEEISKFEQAQPQTPVPEVKAPEPAVTNTPVTIEEYKQPDQPDLFPQMKPEMAKAMVDNTKPEEQPYTDDTMRDLSGMANKTASDVVRTAAELTGGIGGFGAQVATGLAKIPGSFVGLNPDIEELNQATQGAIKKGIENVEEVYGGNKPQPESYYDGRTKEQAIEDARKAREEFKGNTPNWFENFKTVAKNTGGKEMVEAGKSLIDFPLSVGKEIYDTVVEGDPEAQARFRDNPVKFFALPYAAGKMVTGYANRFKKQGYKPAEQSAVPNEQSRQLLDQWLGKEELPSEKPSGNTPPLKDVAPEDINTPKVEQPPASEPVIKENPFSQKNRRAEVENAMLDQKQEALKEAFNKNPELKITATRAQEIIKNVTGESVSKEKARIILSNLYKLEKEKVATNPIAEKVEIPKNENIFQVVDTKDQQVSMKPKGNWFRSMTRDKKVVGQPMLQTAEPSQPVIDRTVPPKNNTNFLVEHNKETFMDGLLKDDKDIKLIDYDTSAKNLNEMYPDGPVILKNNNGLFAVITKSVKKMGEWQSTVFDKKGPVGDRTFKTREMALRETLHDGYRELSNRNEFSDLTKETKHGEYLKTKKEMNEAFKKSQETNSQSPKEFGYELKARPFGIGAQPKGQIRVDESSGGRFGSIYYDRPLTEKEMKDYELKPISKDVSPKGINTPKVEEPPANEPVINSIDKNKKILDNTPQNIKAEDKMTTIKPLEEPKAQQGFGKGLYKVEAEGYVVHGVRDINELYYLMNNEKEGLLSTSTSERSNAINRNIIVKSKIPKTEGLYAPYDADAGKNFGYDELRIDNKTFKDNIAEINMDKKTYDELSLEEPLPNETETEATNRWRFYEDVASLIKIKENPSENIFENSKTGPSMFGGAQIQNWWDKMANSKIGQKIEKGVKDFIADEEGALKINQDIIDMFKRGPEAIRAAKEAIKENTSSISKLKENLQYGYEAVDRRLREMGLPQAEIDQMNEYYEKALYTDSMANNALQKAKPKIFEEFKRGGVNNDDLNAFAFLWRIAEGERVKYDPKMKAYMEVENWDNINSTEAKRRLSLYSPEQLTALKNSFDAYDQARQPIIDEVIKTGVFASEQNQALIDNKAYSTNKVVDYMVKEAGKNEPSGNIYEQVGSTKDILAPHDQKILKDQSMLKFAKKQQMRYETINKLSGTTAVSSEPKSGYSKVSYMRNGEYQDAYVPDSIAEVLNNPEGGYDMQAAATKLFAFTLGGKEFNLDAPIKKLTNWTKRVTTSNPKFILTNSMWKDPMLIAQNVPGYRAPITFIKQYLGDLYDMMRGKENGVQDEIANRMILNKKRYEADEAIGEPNKELSGGNPLDNYFDMAGNVDTLPKVSLFKTIKQYQKEWGWTDEQVNQFVRAAGTPSTLLGGKFKKPLDQVGLFFNAAAQGWRFEAQSFHKDPWGYAIKKAAIPTMLAAYRYMAENGYLGKQIQDDYKDLPTYASKFFTIPIGRDDKGKIRAVTFAIDRFSSLVNSTVFDMMNNDKKFADGVLGWLQWSGDKISDFTTNVVSEAPSLTPAAAIMTAPLDYIAKQPIYDRFRKQEILSPNIMESNESIFDYLSGNKTEGNKFRKDIAFAKYFINQYITAGLFRADTDFKNKGDWWSALQINPATAFYRKFPTNTGEKVSKIVEKGKSQTASQKLNIDEYLGSGKEYPDTFESIGLQKKYFKGQLLNEALKGIPEAKLMQLIKSPDINIRLEAIKELEKRGK